MTVHLEAGLALASRARRGLHRVLERLVYDGRVDLVALAFGDPPQRGNPRLERELRLLLREVPRRPRQGLRIAGGALHERDRIAVQPEALRCGEPLALRSR